MKTDKHGQVIWPDPLGHGKENARSTAALARDLRVPRASLHRTYSLLEKAGQVASELRGNKGRFWWLTGLRVMTKAPGQDPVVGYVPNTLKALRAAVLGDIEGVFGIGLPLHVTLYCNGDGKATLPPNFPIHDGQDVVHGPVIFTNTDPATGNEIDLTDEQIQGIRTWLETL